MTPDKLISLRGALLLCFLLALAGCPTSGGDDDDAAGDDDDSTDYVKPADWQDMDFDQRKEYMTQVVEPEMQAVFQEYDADKYAEFACATCHGDDGEDVDYEMPNGLHPLSFPLNPTSPEEEADIEFMEDEVIVDMAALVDQVPGTNGFRCTACHELE